jgi:hypothetical protein
LRGWRAVVSMSCCSRSAAPCWSSWPAWWPGRRSCFPYAQLHAASEAEIALAAGNRTVWEWSNLVEPGYVGLVTDVQRVTRDAVPWLRQPCPKGALPVAGS